MLCNFYSFCLVFNFCKTSFFSSKDLQDVKKQKEKDEQIKKEKEKQEGLVAISKEVSKYLNLFKSKEETYLNNLTKCSDVARFQKEGQVSIMTSSTYFRLSLAKQRGNAISIEGSFPQTEELLAIFN